jgi:hypothetical protein
MMLSLGILSLLQILSGGTGRIFAARFAEPFKWTISYVGPDGKTTVARGIQPVGDQFNEGRTKSPISVEMDLRECQTFNSYRFWVGPYGVDSTDRQPSAWTLFVRGDDGDWVVADSEQITKRYQNDTWYVFPLHAGKSCIRHVRWDIGKLSGGEVFRLYRFQLYNPTWSSMTR